MWFLVPLALAADPTLGDTHGVPVEAGARAPSAPLTDTVGRCDHGQRCDDQCISWTEVCPSTLRASVAALVEAERIAALGDEVCELRLEPRAPPPLPAGAEAVTNAVGSILCLTAGIITGSLCDPFRATVGRLPEVPPPASPCGDPPTIAPPPIAPPAR